MTSRRKANEEKPLVHAYVLEKLTNALHILAIGRGDVRQRVGDAYLALGDDISAALDVAMAVRRDGIPGNRTPDGILTRLHETTLGRIIQEIESRPERPG